MKKLAACLAAFLLFSHGLFAQKISEHLRQQFLQSAGQPQPMIVLMAAQADVSDAANISDWNEKGWHCYHRLSSLAEKTQGNVAALCRAFGTEPRQYWIVNMVAVDAGSMALAEALAALPEVREVLHVASFYMEQPIDPTEERGDAHARAVTYEWGLQKIKADSVWLQGWRGTGIVVGGQDTGYQWDHPAIKDAYRGWDGTAVDHDYNWHDAIHQRDSHYSTDNTTCPYNMTSPCDDNNHGTHTMGTMVGKDSTGPGNVQYIGVAPDAKWIGCRNMDRGYGTPVTYSECFQWFLAPTRVDGSDPDPSKRPHVINNSWGCPLDEGCNTAIGSTHWIIRTALINLRNAGTVVVVSAGNSGPNCHTVQDPPAMYEAAYSIGASNSTDGIANFSSRGKVSVDTSFRMKPQIVAPGVSVRSSIPTNSYATFSGTSMAGPHCAGAVALLLDAVPSLIGNPGSVESYLNANAKSLPGATTQVCDGITTGSNPTIPNPVWGYGRLDIKKTIAAASTLPIELVSFTGRVERRSVRLSWQTATESGCAHFRVEKSSDGLRWQPLGKVACHGTTTAPNSYQLIDNQPIGGMNYYRLRQFDVDGDEGQGSPVAAVPFYPSAILGAYPSPAADQLTVSIYSERETSADLEIFDANGRLVRRSPMPLVAGSLTFEMGVGELSGGVYFLKLMEEGGRSLGDGKFVKD